MLGKRWMRRGTSCELVFVSFVSSTDLFDLLTKSGLFWGGRYSVWGPDASPSVWSEKFLALMRVVSCVSVVRRTYTREHFCTLWIPVWTVGGNFLPGVEGQIRMCLSFVQAVWLISARTFLWNCSFAITVFSNLFWKYFLVPEFCWWVWRAPYCFWTTSWLQSMMFRFSQDFWRFCARHWSYLSFWSFLRWKKLCV